MKKYCQNRWFVKIWEEFCEKNRSQGKNIFFFWSNSTKYIKHLSSNCILLFGCRQYRARLQGCFLAIVLGEENITLSHFFEMYSAQINKVRISKAFNMSGFETLKPTALQIHINGHVKIVSYIFASFTMYVNFSELDSTVSKVALTKDCNVLILAFLLKVWKITKV